MPEIFIAETNKDFDDAALLFKEYAAWLQIDLCFQKFDEELKELRQMYGPPAGAIFLCKHNDQLAGCVAVRNFAGKVAELKRMWVRPGFRSLGIGEALLMDALVFAKDTGYTSINLDTLVIMTPAIQLYKKHGFSECAPYYHNPHEDARYFTKTLS